MHPSLRAELERHARRRALVRMGLGATTEVGTNQTPYQQAGGALYVIVGGSDGCNNPGLSAAATTFQQQAGIAVTGQYDAATQTALGQYLTSIGSSNTAPAACAAAPLTMPMQTITSGPAPDYAGAVIVTAVAVAAGLVAWGWMSRKHALAL